MIIFLHLIAAMLVVAFVHELGHLVMARAFGVRVPLVRVGGGLVLLDGNILGTKWEWGWTCMGGYTRIHGMDKADAILKGGGDYRELHYLQRILLALGGVAANVLLAMCVYAAHAWWQGSPPVEQLIAGVSAPLDIVLNAAHMWGYQLGILDTEGTGIHRFDGSALAWCYCVATISLVVGMMNLIPTTHTDGGRVIRILRDEERL